MFIGVRCVFISVARVEHLRMINTVQLGYSAACYSWGRVVWIISAQLKFTFTRSHFPSAWKLRVFPQSRCICHKIQFARHANDSEMEMHREWVVWIMHNSVGQLHPISLSLSFLLFLSRIEFKWRKSTAFESFDKWVNLCCFNKKQSLCTYWQSFFRSFEIKYTL